MFELINPGLQIGQENVLRANYGVRSKVIKHLWEQLQREQRNSSDDEQME